MKVELNKVGKRYRQEWILRELHFVLEPGQRFAVTGPNGAGKSTLLKLLSGHLTPSRGKITFSHTNGKVIDPGNVYKYLNFSAPYIDLIEELTLMEALTFHQQFKPFYEGLNPAALVELLGFKRANQKQIRHFSSGMKQRLKLLLSICSESELLLLDEPTSNLDQQGVRWYLSLVERFGGNRLIVVASNVEADYAFCQQQIDILEFK